MQQRSWAVVGAFVVLAVAFVIVGILYQTGNLEIGTSTGSGKHGKHAIVAYALALLSLVAASFARPRPV